MNHPRLSKEIPNRKQIKREVENAEGFTFIEDADRQIDTRNYANDDAVNDMVIQQNFKSEAVRPMHALMSFLKDRKFDYNACEWSHIAYTHRGLC